MPLSGRLICLFVTKKDAVVLYSVGNFYFLNNLCNITPAITKKRTINIR